MAKQMVEPPECDGDDWLVVGCDDESRADAGPKARDDERGLEASQPQNQIHSSEEGPESDPTPNQHWSHFQVSESENLRIRLRIRRHACWTLMLTRCCAVHCPKLLVWRSGLAAPRQLEDESRRPLAVAASASSAAELRRLLLELVLTHPQLLNEFPQVTRTNVSDAIQVCQRAGDAQLWAPLATLEAEDSSSSAELKLTPQVERLRQETWPQLLLESRSEDAACDDKLAAWRCGKFYSEIQANAWRFELQIGQLLDALDTDKHWYESRVVDMDAVYVRVHYRGWTSKWDEWVRRTSARLAPLHTKVPNWRAFRVGDTVMVGTEVPGKRYPEWRNAHVTACDEEDGLLQIEVDIDGNKKWLDAQDELLCPPGTHKAVNGKSRAASALLAAPSSLLFDYFEQPDGPASSQAHNDQSEKSIRQATHTMNLADSCDADGDEWCVVDDDRDEDRAETGANADISNQTEDAVAEGEARDYEESGSCDENYDCSRASHDTPSTNTAATPILDQIFTTTTEVLQEQVDDTVRDEDTWRNELQIDQLIDARDTDSVWYVIATLVGAV
ncbi:unnamed protein product [Phytophthora fragariaefolia]|uniref:Unnamed protein product n=1 Tax=Phytophthora fragariaefolia TaxID=1490495 RepID=A0A9W6XUZ6_9STRA|nr:unnamed protein product [Phytophthora fragariaefolia]